jgi:hypothetical protein
VNGSQAHCISEPWQPPEKSLARMRVCRGGVHPVPVSGVIVHFHHAEFLPNAHALVCHLRDWTVAGKRCLLDLTHEKRLTLGNKEEPETQ